MKLSILFLTLVISINSFAQSKKEQIVILNSRLDSLNKAYVKDTIGLGKAIRKIDGVKDALSEQLDKTKEQLIKKSATVTEKSNTIKSLNAKNMELMQDLNVLRTEQKNIAAQNKALRVSLDSINKINEMPLDGIIIPKNAIPFHGIFNYEDQYDGTWTYEIDIDKGPFVGLKTLHLQSGFEDSLELKCDCPKMIPEGSRILGFAIKSTCFSEDYSDGTKVSKECYRPIILRIY